MCLLFRLFFSVTIFVLSLSMCEIVMFQYTIQHLFLCFIDGSVFRTFFTHIVRDLNTVAPSMPARQLGQNVVYIVE